MDVKINKTLDRQFILLLLSIFGSGFMTHSNFYENHIAIKLIGAGLTTLPILYSIILNRKLKSHEHDLP